MINAKAEADLVTPDLLISLFVGAKFEVTKFRLETMRQLSRT